MKISATLILLIIATSSVLKSQNVTSTGTKIDDAEKRRLENKFKSLKTFYISDDGLVVYQPDAQPIEQNTADRKTTKAANQETRPATNNAPSFGVPVVTRNNSQNSSYLVNEESTSGTTRSPRSNTSALNSNASSASEATGFVKKTVADPINLERQEAAAGSSTYESREITNNRSASINNEKVVMDGGLISSSIAIPISEIPISVTDTRKDNNTPALLQKTAVETKSIAVKQVKQEPAKEVTKAKDTQIATKNLKKGDIFKKKLESSYSSLEEAALASEALLETLQNQSKKGKPSGSISERIASGAKKPLKKEALDPTLSQNIFLSSSMSNSETNDNMGSNDLVDDEFGDQPTYYINGAQVDKSVVDKLKSKDILRRQTKTRNIKSGNPNGEVWIDTY